MCQEEKRFSDFFALLQYGVATEGGSELLIHQIQLLLESNNDWVVLKTDVKNAFNTINRSDMIDQVFASFPDIGNHVVRMYSAFSDLVISRGNSTVILSSQEGVHQGDPLGPVLFSIAIHPVLLDLQSAHRDVVVLAYLDDIFVLGPPSKAMLAFDDLKSAFSNIGLEIGRWGEEATNYLQELSARSTKNPNESKCYWRKRFSATLQRCNAKTIARKLSHLTSTRVSNVDDFLTQFYVH